MKKTMISMFVNLFRFIMNKTFFGFTNIAPVGKKSAGAFFSDSVVFVSEDDFTAEGIPQTGLINRLEKFTTFYRRLLDFFSNKNFKVKFAVTFVFDSRRAFDDAAMAKFAEFLKTFFDQRGFENFEISVAAFDEFFGSGKSFDFNARVKFAAFDINNEFPFNSFDYSNEFGFFFVDGKQKDFAFPFNFGFNSSTLKTV